MNRCISCLMLAARSVFHARLSRNSAALGHTPLYADNAIGKQERRRGRRARRGRSHPPEQDRIASGVWRRRDGARIHSAARRHMRATNAPGGASARSTGSRPSDRLTGAPQGQRPVSQPRSYTAPGLTNIPRLTRRHRDAHSGPRQTNRRPAGCVGCARSALTRPQQLGCPRHGWIRHQHPTRSSSRRGR